MRLSDVQAEFCDNRKKRLEYLDYHKGVQDVTISYVQSSEILH
jgi:hypothetical protein